MSISESRLAANRRNALRSTGPRTAAGKKQSRLNACRHGLTSQVVVLPEDDMIAYKAFCQGYFAEWGPKTPTESQLVQTLIDTQWRLNSARAREHAMSALGQFGPESDIDTGNPQIDAALIAARMLLERSHELDNLSKHEQRQTHILHSTLKLLRELQAARQERERIDLFFAVDNFMLHKMKEIPYHPAEDGFVLTARQIEDSISREQRRQEAGLAKRVSYDIVQFRKALAA